MSPPTPSEDGVLRGSSAADLDRVHRALHLFSFVGPRPKTPEGDSLRIAWRVPDAAHGAGLLAALGLRDDPAGLHRPPEGPFAGTAVLAAVDRHPAGPDGDPRMDDVVVVVTLWNEPAVHDVTVGLVGEAALIERRLDEAGFGALPRDLRLHGWVPRP